MYMQKLTLALVILVMVAVGWLYYDNQQQLQQARVQSAQLEQQVAQLHEQINTLQLRVERLSNHSVEGIVRQANNAILDGWESLVSGVEKELKKAREKAAEEQGNQAQSPADDAPANRVLTDNAPSEDHAQ
jgi:phage shock protein A